MKNILAEICRCTKYLPCAINTVQRFFSGKDMAATEPQSISKLKLAVTALSNPSKVRPQYLDSVTSPAVNICALISITRSRRLLLPNINSWSRKHLKMILKRRRCARVSKPCWACARIHSIRITILAYLVYSIHAACLAKEAYGLVPFQIYTQALL